MTRLFPWLSAMTLLVAAGLMHGVWTERWVASDALKAAAARVEQVPLEIGDWQGKPVDTDADSYAMAGARSYWARLYTHRYGGGSVLAILMCGRSGRMSVHTPEVCYRGAGYDLLETPVRTLIRDDSDEPLGSLWSARFSKQAGAATSDLRLDWGWNGGDGWQAPVNPRWEFRGRPFLYKLYVSYELNAASDRDLAGDFLQQFLPALKDVLAEPGS